MSYVEFNDLKGVIPEDFLIQSLDDDGDGVVDSWTTVQRQACDAVDALLCGRYQTPFAEPTPKIVTTAALNFAAEACYQRRGRIEDQNPFSSAAGRYRAQLQKIAKGDLPLTPEVTPADAEAPTVISAPSKATSRRGRTPV